MKEYIEFKGTKCRIEFGNYAVDNSPSIRLIDLEDGSVFSRATVWIEGLAADEIAIKNYSENEGLYDVLLASGIIKPYHRLAESGFVEIPVCRLKKERSVAD